MLLTIITIIFLVSASFLSVIRLSSAIEPSGLFIRNHPTSVALAVILVLFAFFIIFICIKKYRFSVIEITNNFKPLLLGKISAILILAASFLKIISIFISYTAAKINIGEIVIIILTLLTMFYYIAMLTLFNKGKTINYISGIALIPVLWSVATLIVNYVSLTQMSTTPEYCYIILAYVINILFFYYVAKVLSGYKCVLQCLIASAFSVIINGVAYISTLISDISKLFIASSTITLKDFVFHIFANLVFIMIIPFALSFIVFLTREAKEIKPVK